MLLHGVSSEGASAKFQNFQGFFSHTFSRTAHLKKLLNFKIASTMYTIHIFLFSNFHNNSDGSLKYRLFNYDYAIFLKI